MPLLIDVTIALAAGTAALLMTILYARSGATPARPSLEVARAVGQSVRPHRRLRRLIATRLDRRVATGLLLTLALSSAFAAAVLVGILIVLVRSVPALQHVDDSVAAWAFDHRSSASTKGLHLITDLGSAQIVLLLAVVLVIVDFIRTRDRWCAPFLIVVLGGRELLTLRRQGSGRARAAGLGRSRCDPRSFVSKRALSDRRGFLRRGGAHTRKTRRTPWPGCSCRARRRRRRRGRRESSPARPSLADGRARRPRARVGMVRSLRRHLRRQAPPAHSGCRHRRCGSPRALETALRLGRTSGQLQLAAREARDSARYTSPANASFCRRIPRQAGP